MGARQELTTAIWAPHREQSGLLEISRPGRYQRRNHSPPTCTHRIRRTPTCSSGQAAKKRLSNFLLWQSAYRNFISSINSGRISRLPILDAAIDDYSQRDRRFGQSARKA